MRFTRLALALACLPTGLSAQTLLAKDTSTATCGFDTLGHTFTDTVTIALAPARLAKKSQTARTDYLMSAEAIREHFQPPHVVALPLWARTAFGSAHIFASMPVADAVQLMFPAHYGLHGYIVFRLTKTGRLADSAIHVESASPDIRDAVIAAIRGADSALAFSPPSDDVRDDDGKIILEFVQLPYRWDRSVPLVRVIVPVLKLEDGPKELSAPRPLYPDSPLNAHLSDHVITRFAIGANGRVVPGSVDFLQAEYRDFVVEVLRVLDDARFTPAHIGGCALPTLVDQSFNFHVR